jgi:hypothetical protein
MVVARRDHSRYIQDSFGEEGESNNRDDINVHNVGGEVRDYLQELKNPEHSTVLI